MKSCKRLIRGVLLLCLSVASFTAKADEICARKTCIEGAFKYTIGRTYKYTYLTEITTTLPNQPEAKTFSLALTAEVGVISPCSHRLSVQLDSVSDQDTVFPTNAIRELKNELEKNTIDFGFYNGVIGEVCSASEETALSLNIKKGLLSTFQISAGTPTGFTKGTFVERDFAGECPTVYTLTYGERDEFTLNKTRTLSQCKDRTTSIPELLESTLGSAVQSLLESTPSCQHIIRDGVLRNAVCLERHSLKPFHQQVNPLAVRVLQKLTFQEEVHSIRTLKKHGGYVTGSLRFDLSDMPAETDLTVEDRLGALCAVSGEDIRPETPAAFSKLVDALQAETDCAVQDRIFEQMQHGGSLCLALSPVQRIQILRDIMPAIGNVCSIKLMSRGLKDATDEDFALAELWFTSLAFVRDPTRDMIQALLPLLDNGRLTRSGYLGISTITRNYCLHQPELCSRTVSAVEMSILTLLDPTCEVDADAAKDDKTTTYLKAIGNLGPSSYAMDVLQLIIQCKQKPLAVRVAAIEAFRRRDCTDDSKAMELTSVLADSIEDVELRVMAYRTLMVCPNPDLVRKVMTIATTSDEHIQLKQYIGSHLHNLNHSSAASLSAIREILTELPELVPITGSGLASSRNFLYESGDKNRLAVLEGNVIFADSYLPRTADLGFGIELFGRHLDLLEIGGRADGFEATVERMVGPSGHFSQRSLKDSVMSLLFGSEEKPINRKLLSDRLKKQRKEFAYKEGEADFMAYFRMFGNDLSFVTLQDLQQAADSFMDGYFDTLDFLFGRTKLQPFEVSRNIILHDGDYEIRTVSGLPLNLKLAATASGKISGKTNMDIGGLFGTGSTVRLAGRVTPSFAVQVAATFKINLKGVSTGFSSVSTLHSSTDLSGSLEYQNGVFIKSSLDMPKDKIEFVTFDSKSFGIRGTEERLIVSDPAVAVHSGLSECTAPLTSRLLGLEFCAELDSEDPINSNSKRDGLLPSNFRIFLRKTDPGLTSYNFGLEYPTPSSFRFFFDTPGSLTSRHFELSYLLDRTERSLVGTIATPWKEFELSGQFTSLGNLRLDLMEDNQRSYSLEVGSEGRIVDGYYNMQPKITLKTPFSDDFEVTGSINSQLRGEIDVSADLVVKNPLLNSRLLLTHKREYRSLATQGTVQYRVGRASRSQEMMFNFKSRDFPTVSGLLKKGTTVSVEFTEFPDFNTLVQSDVVWSPDNWLNHLDHTLNFYCKNFQDESRKITARTFITKTRVADRWNLTSGFSVVRLPVEFALVHTMEFHPTGNFFDGRVSTQGIAGAKSLRLAWSNKWATERRISVEADAADDAKHLNMRGLLRDQSAFMSRSYPFEVTLQSSKMPPLAVSGELIGTRSDIGLNLDVHQEGQKYLTSSHSMSWNPLAVTSQYQLHTQNQAGNTHMTVKTPTDWTVRSHWTHEGAQWTSMLSLVPHSGHGFGLIAMLTKGNMIGMYHGGLYQERKYGVDVQFFQEPADTRTSLTVYTGLTSHQGQVAFQISRKPAGLVILSLVDITISPSPAQSLIFESASEATINADEFSSSVTILQNFTTTVSSYLLVEQIFSFREKILKFELQNEIGGTPLIALNGYFDRMTPGNVFFFGGYLNGSWIRYRDLLDGIELYGQITPCSDHECRKTISLGWYKGSVRHSIDLETTRHISDAGTTRSLTLSTPFPVSRFVELKTTTTMDGTANQPMRIRMLLSRNDATILNATGAYSGFSGPDMVGWNFDGAILLPTLIEDTVEFATSKNVYLENGRQMPRALFAVALKASSGPIFNTVLYRDSVHRKLVVETLKRLATVTWNDKSTEKSLDISWELGTDKSIRIGRSVDESSLLNAHAETWSFSDRMASPSTVKVQFSPTPALAMAFNTNHTLRLVAKISRDSVLVNALYAPEPEPLSEGEMTIFEPSHVVGAEFLNDDTFHFEVLGASQPILSYRATLERNKKLHQTASWNTDSLKLWKAILIRDGGALLGNVKRISDSSVTELKSMFQEVTAYPFNFSRGVSLMAQPADRPTLPLRELRFHAHPYSGPRMPPYGPMDGHPGPSYRPRKAQSSESAIPSEENILSRPRRNAFAFAGASSGGCGGAFAGAGAGSQCGGGGGDFAAAAAGMHAQMNQMMQDMVSKFQSHSSSSGYSGGGTMSMQFGQSSSPCGSSQQRTSYGGCAPAPQASYPQQTHRIEIQVGQPQASYQDAAPSPCGSPASSPCGSPSPSYYQPQTQYQPQRQPSGGYQASSGYSSSGVYSTSVDAQPSYGPVDAYQSQPYGPAQGDQIHSPQKSSSGSPQSFSVPVGNTRLTIQIHQADSPQPAPQPQGGFQYMASGSQQSQNQYAIAGQIPYGGGAEPRLQYCTPGSSEKGVCLHSEDSLEPTRTKRSLEEADLSWGGFNVEPYLQVVKKTARDVWTNVVAQPEVQYILDISQRISNHISYKVQSHIASMKSHSTSFFGMLRSFGPTVTRLSTGSIDNVVVEQELPISVVSLRNPLPKTFFYDPTGVGLFSMAGSSSMTRPFFGTAMLYNGGKSLTTFDAVNYTLDPAPCQYIFAHDFDDGNFTIVLGYDFVPSGGAKVHLTGVTVLGRLSSFSFNVTSLPVEGALVFPDFVVTIVPENSITITSMDGWSVLYEIESETLSLEVTGLYYDKVAGLAGSFNFNRKNDFITPNHTVLERSQLGMFVEAWQADDSCPRGSIAY